MVENNSLPIVYKKELPVKIGLLPHTATSGDEVGWVGVWVWVWVCEGV